LFRRANSVLIYLPEDEKWYTTKNLNAIDIGSYVIPFHLET